MKEKVYVCVEFDSLHSYKVRGVVKSEKKAEEWRDTRNKILQQECYDSGKVNCNTYAYYEEFMVL